MPDHDIAIHTLVFFQVCSEFKYGHAVFTGGKVVFMRLSGTAKKSIFQPTGSRFSAAASFIKKALAAS
jgi:hypothetical protein